MKSVCPLSGPLGLLLRRLLLAAPVALALASLVPGLATPGWAQQIPGTPGLSAQTLPPSADPGRLEQRFERPQLPQSKPDIVFPAPEQAPPPERAGKVKFVLTGIVFEGASVIRTDDLKPLYESLIGKEITLLDVYQVRDAITAKLRNDGYILSQAAIPAQTVKGGLVRIVILEGAINNIRFEGQYADRFGLLRRYADKIMASRPLLGEDLERYVLLMDDLPGVKVKTVLQPTAGSTVGSDLVVILERKRLDASVTVDNRGTRSVGPLQIDHSVAFNDLAGVFEKTAVRGIITPEPDELRFLDLTHSEQIDAEGSTFTVGVRRSWSLPADNLRPFKLKSMNSTLRFGVAHPLIRSRAETLRVDAAFDYRNSRTNSLGARLNEDRLRVVSYGLAYDVSDGFQGSNLFNFRFSHGLDVLHSTVTGTNNMTRADGRSDFAKVTFSYMHLQPLPAGFGLSFGGDGQWSADQLLSSEEFGIGGSQYGRAFDSSELTGDRGLAGKIELSYTPNLELPGLTTLQLYAFTDIGGVNNYEDGPRHGWQTLASAGGGIRFGITDYVSATLELAKPFLRNTNAANDHDERGFFSLTARY